MADRRTTLTEVASQAGVSVATVSKVLNGRTDVAAQTRRRVLRHLREASYQPTGSAVRERLFSRLIEVVFPDMQNPYSVTVLQGITEVAHEQGFDIVIGRNIDSSAGGRDLDPELLIKSGRAGAVFITMDTSLEHLRALRAANFPVVVVDPVHRVDVDCFSIGATNFTGGVAATDHLLAAGHRRIGHAGGPEHADYSQARLAGYSSALRQAGIAMDESLVTHSSFDYEGGRRSAGYLLDRDDPPTAIFAGNDEIAMGVMEEARRRSIRIPGDLSVVGFDDTFLATRSAPQLTTVAQPLVEMGRLAVRSLARMLDSSSVEGTHMELATRLVIRDSTAPPSPTPPAPALATARRPD